MSSGNEGLVRAGATRDHGTCDAAIVSRVRAAGVSWHRRVLRPLRVTDTKPCCATTSTSPKPAIPPVREMVKGKSPWEP